MENTEKKGFVNGTEKDESPCPAVIGCNYLAALFCFRRNNLELELGVLKLIQLLVLGKYFQPVFNTQHSRLLLHLLPSVAAAGSGTGDEETTSSKSITTTSTSVSVTSTMDVTESLTTTSSSSYSDWSSATSSASTTDWDPTPTSTTWAASSSEVPSIEMLFMYLYEALGAPDIDHLRRRKKREAEAPSLLEKRDLAFRDDKQRRLLKKREGKQVLLLG
ncbi:hypothetical protein OS493_011272 [Desmophyllum pertusum]|uniref:Uncharacterized protein n=1 Tax=Desmophyllum pertusum TaxID=174260 RepID=A0A9X0CTI8_9CNID|nr:hypothetical protein OS493_011272 [Desmophyllum pertusum]